ncbi:hydroxyisourate hydrolase [soil metagenome]
MARLSTHVLDTRSGTPAAGMRVVLERLDGGIAVVLRDVRTNGDGRTSEPLLSGDAIEVGRYRLSFSAADYFRQAGVDLPDPPFFDVVTIDFGLADAQGHYHVPLLVSPWAYSTYRGS